MNAVYSELNAIEWLALSTLCFAIYGMLEWIKGQPCFGNHPRDKCSMESMDDNGDVWYRCSICNTVFTNKKEKEKHDA